MATTRFLLNKSHSNVTSQFLRKPFNLTTPIISQSTITDDSLRLPLPQKSHLFPPPSPAFSLPHKKLLLGDEGFLCSRQFPLSESSSSGGGGSFWARGRGGPSSSSRKQVDSEDEFDDDEVDEFDDDDDDFPEDLDGKFSDDFDDDDDEDEDEIDDKPKRKK